MDTNILNLLKNNTLFVVIILTIVTLFVYIFFLHLKIRRLLMGKNAKSLEDAILEMQKKINNSIKFENNTSKYLQDIERRLKRSIQGVETIKFNPFKGNGDGGNQSFASAFINEKGDGIILSSLYSRDRISVFSKPIKGLSSEFELSKEEKQVLDKTKNSIQEK